MGADSLSFGAEARYGLVTDYAGVPWAYAGICHPNDEGGADAAEQ